MKPPKAFSPSGSRCCRSARCIARRESANLSSAAGTFDRRFSRRRHSGYRPAIPVNSIPEFIGYAKSNPGSVSVASFGAGTVSHVAIELFKMRAGVDIVHVPYRGSAPMVPDLIGGQVQAAIDNLPTSIEHIKSRRL